MPHDTKINKYNGTHEELAHDISRLRYDVLSTLLADIASEILKDRHKDAAKGRKMLATALSNLNNDLEEASFNAAIAWTICKPFEEKGIR